MADTRQPWAKTDECADAAANAASAVVVADEEPACSELDYAVIFSTAQTILTVRSGCATGTPPTHSQSHHPATAKTTICHDPILRPKTALRFITAIACMSCLLCPITASIWLTDPPYFRSKGDSLG